MSISVKVINTNTQTILYETSIENLSNAYDFALKMENLGIDVEIQSPAITETLIDSLGANPSQLLQYKESLIEEIAEHPVDNNESCGFCHSPRELK